LVYVDTSHVRDGALGELEEAIAELAEFVQENEPQLISYGVVFSEDCDLMTVVHVHPDPSSLDHHLDVAGPRFQRFSRLLSLSSIEVRGAERQGAAAVAGQGQVTCIWGGGRARAPCRLQPLGHGSEAGRTLTAPGASRRPPHGHECGRTDQACA
jgi:hypothetical protein